MAKSKKKKVDVRKVDVDRAAIINERIKALTDELKTLKVDFDEALNAEEILEGFAFQVEKTKAGETSGKVDYRAELVGQLGKNGEAKVEQMEKDAAAIRTPGTPKIIFRANPNASEAVLSKSLKMRSLVLKAIANGQATADVSDELERLAKVK